jgi:hypothetical protein
VKEGVVCFGVHLPILVVGQPLRIVADAGRIAIFVTVASVFRKGLTPGELGNINAYPFGIYCSRRHQTLSFRRCSHSVSLYKKEWICSKSLFITDWASPSTILSSLTARMLKGRFQVYSDIAILGS